MQNTFAGTKTRVGNQGVRSVIDEIMHFRTQVTRHDEIRQAGGWNDPLNQLLAEGLGRVRQTLALVSYQQRNTQDNGESATDASAGQRELERVREQEAVDESATLRGLWGDPDAKPLAIDDVQMPAGLQSKLGYDFSGKDPRWPQLSDPKFENVFLRQFVTVLDMAVRDLSNLACAEYGDIIPTRQSVMIHNHLQRAFAILQTKGGKKNAPHIVNANDPEDLTGKVGLEVVPVQIENPAPEAVVGA